MQKETNAEINIHKDDAPYMEKRLSPLGDVAFAQGIFEDLLGFIISIPLPRTGADILVKDGDVLHEYGFDAKVIHLPGHTSGHCGLLLYDKKGIYAIVGDLLSNRNNNPRIQHSYAHNWEQVNESMKKLEEIDAIMLFPGHGKAFHIDDLKY